MKFAELQLGVRRAFLWIAVTMLFAGRMLASDEGGARIPEPTTEKIISDLRKALLENLNLTGSIRSGSRSTKTRFSSSRSGETLVIAIPDLAKKYSVDLSANGRISEVANGANKILDVNDADQEIALTGISVGDLSLSWLFWKRHEKAETLVIRNSECNGIIFFAPVDGLAYSHYTAWYDVKTGMLQRAIGVLRDGSVGRQIDVMSVQKAGDAWCVRTIRFYARDFKKPSYIDFDPPDRTLGDIRR